MWGAAAREKVEKGQEREKDIKREGGADEEQRDSRKAFKFPYIYYFYPLNSWVLPGESWLACVCLSMCV